MDENYVIMPKPEKGDTLSIIYDFWKTMKQTLTVAAPGIAGFLLFLQGYPGLEDITIPVMGGLSAALIVGTIYRVFKNISVEKVPLSI